MSTYGYMSLALEIARREKGFTSPNPVVGAVLVKDERILSQGVTGKAGEKHAEIQALEKSGKETQGATLYTTLEPCCFHGRTPPCTDAIIRAKVKKVIIGIQDPNPKVQGRGIKQLKDAGITVEEGFLQKELHELNEDFHKHITTGLPFVHIKYAMSIDGKIATTSSDSQWISNEKARADVQRLRKESDAILVGVHTILQDNPSLSYRPLSPPSKVKQPLRIVFDTQGRTPLQSKILSDEHPSLIVIKSKHAHAQNPTLIQQACTQSANKSILLDPTPEERISFPYVLQELGHRGILSVLLEGGATMFTAALEAQVIDKITCFIAPKIIMGTGALTPFEGTGFGSVAEAPQLYNVHAHMLDDNVMITGYLNAHNPKV